GSDGKVCRLEHEWDQHLRPRLVGRVGAGEDRAEVLFLDRRGVDEEDAEDRRDREDEQVDRQGRADDRGQDPGVDRVSYEAVWAGGDELGFLLDRHRYAPVPA